MIYFDTSVIVAALEKRHIHYHSSVRLLRRHDGNSASTATHTLAETYAAMTRLPVSPRVSPAEALVLVQEISSRISVVDLTMAEYVETIKRAAAQGISGGTIYDALHLQCARKVNATAIYTWNIRHFRMIAPDLASIIQQPLI